MISTPPSSQGEETTYLACTVMKDVHTLQQLSERVASVLLFQQTKFHPDLDNLSYLDDT